MLILMKTMIMESGLTKYMLDFASQHHIRVRGVHAEPAETGVAFLKNRKISVNYDMKNSNEFDFVLGHEIGHIMNGDSDNGVAYYCGNPLTSEERKADLYSLNLIFDYAAQQFNTFNEPGVFMEQYGIPYRMFDDTVKLYKRRNDLLF
ncbi:hypothetical protein EQ500_03650 [Lactobacillus sp. XV13L]|nr:hypothetical protein [Lactobacillus sp. XV13L]